jgi:hypothetical protein
MAKTYSTTVIYQGFSFEFTGEWVPFFPARLTLDPGQSYPAEGGYFEDFDIKLDDQDIYDLLDADAVNDIVSLAVRERLRGN